MLTTTLPLYDRNGLFVRHISYSEAAKMVDGENAVPIQPRGFRNRRDLAWEGVQLVMDRRFQWSACSITPTEMDAIVGASGSAGEQRAARAKLAVWREIH